MAFVTQTLNLEIEEGLDFYQTFECTDSSTGLPLDLTNATAYITIKFEYLTTPIIFNSSTSSNVVVGGILGTVDVHIPWLSVLNTNWGSGSYGLYITFPSGTTKLMYKGLSTIIRSGLSPNSSGFPTLGDEVLKVAAVVGIGDLLDVPTSTPNGALLGIPPDNATGVRLYLSENDSLTFTISSSQPQSPPPSTFTISGITTGPNWDENLAGGQRLYVTAMTGNPKFRWI